MLYHIPLRLKDPYKGTLAHKIFLHTIKATTHVYAHVWGPKKTCHDALEPTAPVGEAPEARGPPPEVRGPNEVLQKINNVATFSRKIS